MGSHSSKSKNQELNFVNPIQALKGQPFVKQSDQKRPPVAITEEVGPPVLNIINLERPLHPRLLSGLLCQSRALSSLPFQSAATQSLVNFIVNKRIDNNGLIQANNFVNNNITKNLLRSPLAMPFAK